MTHPISSACCKQQLSYKIIFTIVNNSQKLCILWIWWNTEWIQANKLFSMAFPRFCSSSPPHYINSSTIFSPYCLMTIFFPNAAWWQYCMQCNFKLVCWKIYYLHADATKYCACSVMNRLHCTATLNIKVRAYIWHVKVGTEWLGVHDVICDKDCIYTSRKN